MAAAREQNSTPGKRAELEEESHLTRLQRYSYAAGAVGVWGPIAAFSVHRSTVYVIWLGAVRVVALRVRACAFACTRSMHMRMYCACPSLHLLEATVGRPSEVWRAGAGRDGDWDNRFHHGLVERAQWPLRRAVGRRRNAQPASASVCQLGPPRPVETAV